jgi:glycosyltransferase involved in cell wall biosynthesis
MRPKRSAASNGVILAIGPSAGGVGDVFVGSLDALRVSGRRVIADRLAESGSSTLVALKALYRHRHALQAAETVHVEFGSNDLAVFWFAFFATAVRSDIVIVVHDPPKIAHAPGAGILVRSGRWRTRLSYRVLSPLLDRVAIRLLMRRAGAVVVFSVAASVEMRRSTTRPVVAAPHGGRSSEKRRRPPSCCDYVLFAGYLGPRKGLELLIAAWSLVGDVGLRLAIVGGVGVGDASWLAELRSRSASLSRPPQWIGHVESEDDFQRWLDGAAVVVLPYEKSSPASGILVRAMFAGRCIVATRVDAVVDVIEDGISGILLDVGDEAALADRLAAVALDGAQRDRLGAGAELRAAQIFGWDRLMTALEQAYDAAKTPHRSLGRPIS